MSQPSPLAYPRRSSLASTSSTSSEPRPVKQVRFSFPVTVLEAPNYPTTPTSPTFSSLSSEDEPTSKRRRLARLLLRGGVALPSLPSPGIPLSPIRSMSPTRSGFHAGEARSLVRSTTGSFGSRLIDAMRSPTKMGFGRDEERKDSEDEEEVTVLTSADREVSTIDEEDDDESAPLDTMRQSAYHQWHMRWLEIDEDAD